ncbi:Antibiotic biosynthesis monooxygenase [Roseovarius pacificus]|uniref:Antibiotic biosynthesis monooxygenase n=1 Tax=Roseovarius pacificus TaxID=337701 RepID=A0A1M7KKW2_9RHOB|nr:antibiotic biosynthesis monooxygenase [Roseovarius pacificus]GGO62928.1 hypothetical protein GCM10011315_43060 [Roseovarius pacificus]SHM65981.1 Antibiotic biosynthesis monooxygenase [Roseovarius pacificus]
MITELTRLPVGKENGTAFEKSWIEAEKILVLQPGYVSHKIGRVVEDDQGYILEIVWASMEAHVTDFVGSPDFTAFIEHIAQYLNGDADVVHYATFSSSNNS